MSNPVIGSGALRVVDRLMDASKFMFQPIVRSQLPQTISSGEVVIPVYDPSIYVGCLLVCGVTGANIEVVPVVSVGPTSFTAIFENSHQIGEPIIGATFPVRASYDPLYTQEEMLSYIGTATNDFLTDVPLAYSIKNVTVGPTQQYAPLPWDCQMPVRVAYAGRPLRETSQAMLDSLFWGWTQAPLERPRVYFRDKIPVQNVGIFPRMGSQVSLEVIYSQRQKNTPGFADGFIVPDVFTTYILYRTLSFAFSKDGEGRNPALAKFFSSRYEFGVKVSKMILDAVEDNSF